MIPTEARLTELKQAVLARGTPPIVVETLERDYATEPRLLALRLLELRDDGSLKQRLQRVRMTALEPEDGADDWEANRPDGRWEDRP